MQIYRVKRTDTVGFDEMEAEIVAARSPSEAVEISTVARPLRVTRIGTTWFKKPRILLSDFRAG